MTCAESREAMLTAEMEELRAARDSAAHIATCSDCARIADAIIAEMNTLRAALDTLSGMEAAAVPTSHTDVVPITSARSARARRILAAAASIAVLAVGALAVQREMSRRAGDAYPLYLPPVAVSAGPTVNTSRGGAVAVIRTSNPKITLVWYLKPQRGKS